MNLLPIAEKKSVKKGLRLRLIIVVLFLVSSAFAAGFVLLLPSYFLTPGGIFGENPEELLTFSADEEGAKEVLKLPEEINYKLKFLEAKMASPSATEYLIKIVGMMPKEITFGAVTFSRSKDYKDKTGLMISVTGKALNRDSLVSFSNLLKSSGLFSEVAMPVSSLAKDKNIPFSMNLFVEN